MTIKVTENDVFKDNPTLKLFPEFKRLRSDEIKFIALCYDYESMLRKLPIEERKIKAAMACGLYHNGELTRSGKEVFDLKEDRYTKAVQLYKDMQYDEDRESLEAYNEQIREFKEFFNKKGKTLDELKAAKDIQKAFTSAIEERSKLMELLGLRDSGEDEEVDEELSTIEKYHKTKYKGEA